WFPCAPANMPPRCYANSASVSIGTLTRCRTRSAWRKSATSATGCRQGWRTPDPMSDPREFLSANGDRLRIAVGNPSLSPAAGGQPPDVQGAGHAQRSIAHRLGYAFGTRARMASGWRDGYYRCEL